MVLLFIESRPGTLRLTLKPHAVGGTATPLWKGNFPFANGVGRVFAARAFLVCALNA